MKSKPLGPGKRGKGGGGGGEAEGLEGEGVPGGWDL